MVFQLLILTLDVCACVYLRVTVWIQTISRPRNWTVRKRAEKVIRENMYVSCLTSKCSHPKTGYSFLLASLFLKDSSTWVRLWTSYFQSTWHLPKSWPWGRGKEKKANEPPKAHISTCGEGRPHHPCPCEHMWYVNLLTTGLSSQGNWFELISLPALTH